jgi:hypothetical protein
VGEGKPCWITEWGVMNADNSCPISERRRLRVMEEKRQLFSDAIEDGRLAGLIYFSWAYGPWGVYRCEALTPAGELALRPFN